MEDKENLKTLYYRRLTLKSYINFLLLPLCLQSLWIVFHLKPINIVVITIFLFPFIIFGFIIIQVNYYFGLQGNNLILKNFFIPFFKRKYRIDHIENIYFEEHSRGTFFIFNLKISNSKMRKFRSVLINEDMIGNLHYEFDKRKDNIQ